MLRYLPTLLSTVHGFSILLLLSLIIGEGEYSRKKQGMVSYKETLKLSLLTTLVIYGCVMCLMQVNYNRDLEEKVSVSEKKLRAIVKAVERRVQEKYDMDSSCTIDLQAKQTKAAKCKEFVAKHRSLQRTLKEGEEEISACLLKRKVLEKEYKDCLQKGREEADIFKKGSSVNKIKSFLLFVGYDRSGHSLVAALLDAHPHVVISHELDIVRRWKKANESYTKHGMFNEIWENSRTTIAGGDFRSPNRTNKYYVPGLFQGRYENYIQVIGDKKGASAANMDKRLEQDTTTEGDITTELEKFQKFVGHPLKILHIVRNPYDNIAARFLYGMSSKKRKETPLKNKVWNDTKGLTPEVKFMIDSFKRMDKYFRYFGDRMLTLHQEDLIANPKSFLTRACNFLEIQCSSFYLGTAAKSVFSNVTQSRHNVVWDQGSKIKVDSAIKKYPFLQRYSFQN